MTQQWTVLEPQVIEVDPEQGPVRELRVRLVAGRVDVVASTEPGATVEVGAVRGRPLEVRSDGRLLEVAHPHLSWDTFLDAVRAGFSREDAAEVSIAVPPGTSVHLGTVLADGLVAGMAAAVSIRTVSGTIVLAGLSGDVSARTVSGSLDVRDQDGSIGVETVSGPVTVHAVRLPALKAKTVTGSIAVDLHAARSRMSVNSVSGDMTLRIPAGAGFAVDAKTVSGQVVAAGRRLSGFSSGATKGRLADGDEGVHLQAATVSGDVTVLRAGAQLQPAPATIEEVPR